MKKFFQQRWPWFLAGVLFLPSLSFVSDLLRPVSAKDAIPFTAVREESTRLFYFDNDYAYTLRSQGSKEEFLQFVKKMKFEAHRVSDVLYEKRSADGMFRITISYSDGWIIYDEFQA